MDAGRGGWAGGVGVAQRALAGLAAPEALEQFHVQQTLVALAPCKSKGRTRWFTVLQLISQAGWNRCHLIYPSISLLGGSFRDGAVKADLGHSPFRQPV